MIDLSERRKIKQRFLTPYLLIYDEEKNEELGYLADINRQGIMILSENPIQTKQLFTLEIRFNDVEAVLYYEDKTVKHIQFHAESRWCNAKVNPPFFSTGFMLLDISSEALTTIDKLINKLSLRYKKALE